MKTLTDLCKKDSLNIEGTVIKMNKTKILILGGSSYIGRYLFNALGKDRAIPTYYKNPINNGIYFDSLSMDLAQILKELNSVSHAVILLNDTNFETSAQNIEKSNALNIDSLKLIVNCLNHHNITPIFCSSDYVFDGIKGNYTEEDPVNPIITYGKQKVEIEKFIQKTCDKYIIVRFSKVYGSEEGDGTLFTNWLEEITSNKKISCAYDQIFSPVYIDDVTTAIIELIDNDCNGIFHISGNVAFSRLDLLEILLKHFRGKSQIKTEVVRCSIHDFPFIEKRPLNISMKSDKLIKTTKIQLHDINTICKKIVFDHFKK
ncbi:MAG: sugar nucleotide-binding protein [Methanoregula sp.]|jgi:dTDP-4-dehydrorhamnose reductase|uniref:SDR family oxidoreductase n=1 Tax=Methanoregula sp. TaxID=2052170 RepID=UPI0025F2D789|nr:sugar nucleotide-binding protein [Methanoregula sp.]MCK9630288.1 sugar nucleotide-binding protein [Methanoregula sp.]